MALLPPAITVIEHRSQPTRRLCRRRHVVLVVRQSTLIVHMPLVTSHVAIDVPDRTGRKASRAGRNGC